MLSNEKGQALPIVMLLLALGVAVIAPAVYYANVALIAQRNAKEALVDEICAYSANSYAMWKLLYDSTYRDSPTPLTITCNGISATASVGPAPTSNIIGAENGVCVSTSESYPTCRTTYTVAANHEIWAIASSADSSNNGVRLAYDATGAPSRVNIDFTTGTTTYYLHAPDPSPACADPCTNPSLPAPTDQAISVLESAVPYAAMRMTTTAPTNTNAALNYDTGHDSLNGRWIEQSNDGAQCSAKANGSGNNYRNRVVWRTPAFTSSVVVKSVQFSWSWGTEDGGASSGHNITWWVCDFNTTLPFSDTGARNPSNLLGPSGKAGLNAAMWVRPFNVTATARRKAVKILVDMNSASSPTAVLVRSWQMGLN